jgi:anaerobic ribonucleoside-triphosphate reductase activating protein
MISSENGLRIAGIANDSIVDGPGLRITFFFQGCRHACVGCHNPETWPLTGGEETDADALLAKIDANPLLQGVTFSGGEPLLRAAALLPLAEGIRSRGLPLAIYTGYTFEELLANGERPVLNLLAYADTLIDGPFVLAQKSLTLPFRGSRNQRILDIAASLSAGAAVAQADPEWDYHPAS